MGTVNGVDIRVGQVWRTRGNDQATIVSTNAGLRFPVLALVEGVLASYTTTGRWYNIEDDHQRDLVELISEVAGDEHEALTFAPLQPESVTFAEGQTIPVPEVDGEDARGNTARIAPVEPGKHEPTLAEQSTSPITPSETISDVFEELAQELFVIPEQAQVLRDAARVGLVDPGRTNPKDSIGDKKAAMHLLSPIAEAHWMVGQYAGMLKYGAWNWRAAGVRSSVYISAARRHLMAYLSGEEYDPVDGSHHLGNVMACAAILLEASAIGKLVDDRPPSFSHRPTLTWAEDRMAQLKVQYSDKTPRHYTIADNVECGVPEHSPIYERRQADDTEGGAA